MNISEKLKAIRNAEELTQIQLCEIMDISISTLKKIEAGYHEPSITTLSKITKHPRFEKYSLWLISDKTLPDSGQISPDLAQVGIAYRVKAIRNSENLSQSEFCRVIDMPISTLKKIEGSHNDPGWPILEKITNNPRFEKYTLWLMTGKASPEVGQIAPTLVHTELEREISPRKDE